MVGAVAGRAEAADAAKRGFHLHWPLPKISQAQTAAGITLHLVLVRGKNTHHIVEATFKGVARSLRDAVRVEVEGGSVPSTKGTL